MVILWPDIESGSDLVTLNLDGFSDHRTSILEGFGDHLDLILDACDPSHLASILDAPISNHHGDPKMTDRTKMFCRIYCDHCSPGGQFGTMVAAKSLVHRYANTQEWYDQGFVEGYIALVQHMTSSLS